MGIVRLVVLATVGWSSAAWASSTPTAEYARQVSTAQIRLAQLEALLVESQLRIEQLEDVIRQQGKNEAAKLENLDQVNAEVVRLRGAIEVLQFETAEIKRVVSEQQIAVERRQLHAEMRLAQIEKLLSIKPPPPPTDEQLGLTGTATADGGTPPVPAPAPTTDGGTEEAPSDMPEDAAGKLELAAKHMAEGRNLVARAILESAIEQHVGAPEMAEIRYRYAETFFNEKDWRRAISKFNEVINNFPDSPWKCWSFYRQGESFEAMGQGEGAKAFYKGATTDACKTSDAAKEAKKKL
ncbi:MAG: tetratricopeptide repeat protein [Alphaproteobacteria bacterium]|nr:tetratricopeptide repeat protein [Alphaproteobacteria bacterium]MCB9696086.1 tetratricopeptide repeat protein [Alphaproteobacteria bacterium]